MASKILDVSQARLKNQPPEFERVRPKRTRFFGDARVTLKIGDSGHDAGNHKHQPRLLDFNDVAPLEQTRKRLNGLVIKRPGMALGLWGEAGIGKTHVTQNLLRESSSRSVTARATTSLSNLAKALPKPKKLPVWAESMLERLERNEHLNAEQTTSVLAALLSENAPFILHLEDVHETSAEQLEWIATLAKVVTGLKGVALMVTSRTEPPVPFETIRLEALDVGQVKLLLEQEARSSLPNEAIDWIHGKAAGNPLFTLEFFRFLARLGFVWNDGHQWRWRKPESESMPLKIEALIEQQLTTITVSASLERVVESKAVLNGCDDEIWATVADLSLPELRTAKLYLELHNVFTASEFSHPLYQEVIFKNLGEEKIRVYAARALHYFEREQPELAVNFVLQAKPEPVQALALFERGIQKLQTENREIEAAYLIFQSLDFRASEDRAKKAFEALLVLSKIDFRISSQLIQIAQETKINHQETLFVLAQQLALRGDETEALKLLERIEDIDQNQLRQLEMQVVIYVLSKNFKKVLEIIETQPDLLSIQSGSWLAHIVQVLVVSKRASQAQELALRGLELSDISLLERASLLEGAAITFFYQGQNELAIAYWAQSIDLLKQEKMEIRALKAVINRSQALVRKGDRAQALEDLKMAAKTAQQYGNQEMYAQSKTMLAALLTQNADFENAEESLQEARSALEHTKAETIRLNIEFATFELYRAWESAHSKFLMHKHAHQALRIATQLKTETFIMNGLIAVSVSELMIGNAELALEHANLALEKATENNSQFVILSAQTCQANAFKALGETSKALEIFKSNVLSAQAQNLPVHEKENQLEIDFLTKNLEGAAKCLEWFESNGHVIEAAKARRYFPELNGTASTSDDSTQARAASTTLTTNTMARLEFLGSMQTKLAGQTRTVQGRKRQQILVLLLEARISGKSELGRLELLDALYPNDPEDRATSSLRELVRATRANLGVDAIRTTQNGYALGAITSDVETFLRTADSSLWRGAYLRGFEMMSLEDVCDSLELALQTCIHKLLETNPAEAARVSKILLEMNPYSLEILHLNLQAFKASGNHRSLGRIYLEARMRLQEVGEALPERWQDFFETRHSNIISA